MAKSAVQAQEPRMEQIRALAERLAKVEMKLLDANARLPALTREVVSIRTELARATGEPPAQEELKL